MPQSNERMVINLLCLHNFERLTRHSSVKEKKSINNRKDIFFSEFFFRVQEDPEESRFSCVRLLTAATSTEINDE